MSRPVEGVDYHPDGEDVPGWLFAALWVLGLSVVFVGGMLAGVLVA